jgi:phosphoribosyl 1,2-cyclic phosphodiesterase
MSLFITSLNSGSNGNCYYIGNDSEAVLVDAGISCKETERRMERLGLSMDKVKAIFVSHEHADHINGIPVLSKKYGLPVYITPATLRNSTIRIDKTLIRPFLAGEAIDIGRLSVIAFTKMHDAAEPHSFIIAGNGIKIGVFTDIGEPCTEVIRHFRQCRAAFLEANYDEKMLEEGKYPVYLKRRISGSQGHLSNAQALELFNEHRPPYMSHLLLSHLSKENNHPALALELFTAHAGDTEIIVASRYEETAVFIVTDDGRQSLRDRVAEETRHIRAPEQHRPYSVEQPTGLPAHTPYPRARKKSASAANPRQISLF